MIASIALRASDLPASLSRVDVYCILRRIRPALKSPSLQNLMTSKTSKVRLITLTILELTSYPSDQMSCSAIVVFWAPINEASPTPAKPLVAISSPSGPSSRFSFSKHFEELPHSIGPHHLARTRIAASYPKDQRGCLAFLVPQNKLPQPALIALANSPRRRAVVHIVGVNVFWTMGFAVS
jgi:hypothetical protein